MSDAPNEALADAPAAEDAGPAGWAGAPLRSTLGFLALPAAFACAILLFGVRLPSWALYGFGALVGLRLFVRTLSDPEWLLATFVLYIPLQRMFVVPVAPGVNGTNSLLALLLLASVLHRQHGPAQGPAPARRSVLRLVGAWGAVSVLSVMTAGLNYGFGLVLSHVGSDIKGWFDQLIVFFAFMYLIRDGARARRVVLYMMIGGALVLALGVNEWLDKRWLDRIDKARLLGPQLQPNDFGAFLVYISGPFLSLVAINLTRVRAWLLVPYLLVLAKMLLATFSRGAFIAVALAGVMAGWLRGKAFLLVMALLAAGMLAAMPELIPESLAARMSHTTTDTGEVDASSQTRLVLWKAAVAMTLESPLLGKGFKAFPALKSRYTEVEVHESDNHNMFLYIASQMGIPALLVFLFLLFRMWRLGVRVYRTAEDGFGRAVGMGGAALVAGLVGVNMFGSRMVDLSVCAYVWVYLAALAAMADEAEPKAAAELEPGLEVQP